MFLTRPKQLSSKYLTSITDVTCQKCKRTSELVLIRWSCLVEIVPCLALLLSASHVLERIAEVWETQPDSTRAVSIPGLRPPLCDGCGLSLAPDLYIQKTSYFLLWGWQMLWFSIAIYLNDPFRSTLWTQYWSQLVMLCITPPILSSTWQVFGATCQALNRIGDVRMHSFKILTI